MRLLDLKNREVELPSKLDSDFLESKATIHPRPLLQRSHWQSLNGCGNLHLMTRENAFNPAILVNGLII